MEFGQAAFVPRQIISTRDFPQQRRFSGTINWAVTAHKMEVFVEVKTVLPPVNT